MKNTALIIGNSDGIGLALTKQLLSENWLVVGISRSPLQLDNSEYKHVICDVASEAYIETLDSVLKKTVPLDLCVYCAGIGELVNFKNLTADVDTVNVTLMGMVHTLAQVIPAMLENGKGHFIGLSSFADELLSEEAPAYHASKAGFSSYLGCLALALQSKPVHVTNLRFGFVDTKMAKGTKKPLMMPVTKAVWHIQKCIKQKPARYTVPRMAIPLVKFRRLMLNLKLLRL